MQSAFTDWLPKLRDGVLVATAVDEPVQQASEAGFAVFRINSRKLTCLPRARCATSYCSGNASQHAALLQCFSMLQQRRDAHIAWWRPSLHVGCLVELGTGCLAVFDR